MSKNKKEKKASSDIKDLSGLANERKNEDEMEGQRLIAEESAAEPYR